MSITMDILLLSVKSVLLFNIITFQRQKSCFRKGINFVSCIG